jgi:hypothetical protein
MVAVFGLGSGFVNSMNRQFVETPSANPMQALNLNYDGLREDSLEENEYGGPV